MIQEAFVGGYTSSALTCAIRKIRIDTETGLFSDDGLIPGIDNPIYFAVNSAGNRLYATCGAVPGEARGTNGAIAAFAIEEGFSLKLLSLKTFPFSIPCHISLSHDEKALVFAEYSAAHAGVIGIGENGAFEDADPVIVHHEGKGPNPKRQEAAHAHCAVLSPDDSLLLVCDLGQDRVFAYDFTNWRKGLVRVPGSDIATAPGAGPRHLIFSGSGKSAYLVNELTSTVQSFNFDGRVFTPLQTLSMLPENCNCETKAAAIRISPDGKWLLASNRGHDSIAAFRISERGTLSSPVISRLAGSFPRDFAFVPNTNFVFAGHKMSDELAMYAFNPENGELTITGQTLQSERPLAIAYIP